MPEKNCPVCDRPFRWRKKWEGDWDSVVYCSDRCRSWAYGPDGSITDLSDPENPVLQNENWHEHTGLNEAGAHDVNEFKNGFLVTSPISDDMQYLDVRDPLNPKVLGRGKHPTTPTPSRSTRARGRGRARTSSS